MKYPQLCLVYLNGKTMPTTMATTTTMPATTMSTAPTTTMPATTMSTAPTTTIPATRSVTRCPQKISPLCTALQRIKLILHFRHLNQYPRIISQDTCLCESQPRSVFYVIDGERNGSSGWVRNGSSGCILPSLSLTMHASLRQCLIRGLNALADPRGAPGTRAPPWGPNSFIFMQFSAKM